MVQTLGLFSSTALVAGSMIGSGIFLVDADIARTANSPALLLGAWVVTGLLTMIGALSYGELAAMMPKAGGQYVYLRESLGPAVGISLRLDAVPGDSDRNDRRGLRGFRQIPRRLLPDHLDHALAVAYRACSAHHSRPHGAGQHGDRRQHRQPHRHRDRFLSGLREHVWREAGRDDPERLHFGQGAVARGAGAADAYHRTQRNRDGRELRRMAGASSGRMPAGVRCIPCRWALADRSCS